MAVPIRSCRTSAGCALSPIGSPDGGADGEQVLAMRGLAAAAERGRPSCELSPIGPLDGGADGTWGSWAPHHLQVDNDILGHDGGRRLVLQVENGALRLGDEQRLVLQVENGDRRLRVGVASSCRLRATAFVA
ncbi:hypothetical protein T492DRAFT_264301 [Pavlovales sp. CCMP2436]|nr:hypothetical protein T492DRAFT_264301 [Pavlovales sp. CCMP2436]